MRFAIFVAFLFGSAFFALFLKNVYAEFEKLAVYMLEFIFIM